MDNNEQRNPEWALAILNRVYDKALYGFEPVEEMAQEYLRRYRTVEDAAKAMIRNQLIKTTVSGSLSGLGGFAVMLASVPANIAHVTYVQIRMLACLAYMGGYDPRSDEVRTLVFACWAGLSVGSKVIRPAAIKVGEKVFINLIKHIPGKVLKQINRIIGMRFITRFGSKGVINLGKAVPFVGAAIGGGLDFASTKLIARQGYANFIENNFNVGEHIEDFETPESSDVE
ncbi:MAG: EcsC family protein [Proteobacteria bacterium]|nr:EcsC family protein [Pseudomonadota bacterium]